MNTRNTLLLTDTPITALQLSSTRRKPSNVLPTLPQHSSSSIKPELLSFTSSTHLSMASNPQPSSQLLPILSDDNDDLELAELQRKQEQLEQKFLAQTPVFKSPQKTNIDVFLFTAEHVFTKLKYPDTIRVQTIHSKLDESLQQWFNHLNRNSAIIWSEFSNELHNCLQAAAFFKEPVTDDKLPTFDIPEPNDSTDKPSLLDLLRHHVTLFSGDNNPHEWFLLIDSKFSEFNLSFHDRLELLPYFFVGDATI